MPLPFGGQDASHLDVSQATSKYSKIERLEVAVAAMEEVDGPLHVDVPRLPRSAALVARDASTRPHSEKQGRASSALAERAKC